MDYLLFHLTQLVFLQLTTLNHHTSRTSSGLVLLFWPFYLLIATVRLRTMIVTGDLSPSVSSLVLARESLWIASIAIGMLDFLLELFSPEKRWRRMRWKAPWSQEGKIALDEDEEEDEATDSVAGLDGEGAVSGKNEYGEAESPVLTANIYER